MSRKCLVLKQLKPVALCRALIQSDLTVRLNPYTFHQLSCSLEIKPVTGNG